MTVNGRIEDASPWGRGLRATAAGLSWVRIAQGSAAVAVLAVGLAAAGGAAWAVVSARQTMHGRMAAFLRPIHRFPSVHVGLIEVAENTP